MSFLILLASTPSAAYAGICAPPTARGAQAARPFFAGGLTTHSTSLAADEVLLTRAEVAAPERALPKKAENAPKPIDPIADLWRPSFPEGPKGPSVFKLNQGRAIDILRRDYPLFLMEKPDLSIFTPEVVLRDPSGKRLSGLRQYERVFDMMRFLRRTTMQDGEITNRIVVNDETIRVRWSAKLWMRDPALGITSLPNGDQALVHLDGVSVYDLDKEGKIYQHTLENIVMRGQEGLAPVKLGFAWPTPQLATPEMALPFFRGLDEALPSVFAELFQSTGDESAGRGPRHAQQQRAASSTPSRRAPPPQASAARETPMERAARERAEDVEKARELAEKRAPKAQRKEPGFLNAMKGTLPQQCESNYDCERPLVCCDLLFGSVCCSGGMMIPQLGPEQALQRQRQAIPIPVEVDRDGPLGRAPQGPSPPGY